MFFIEVVRKEMRGESEDHKEDREGTEMNEYYDGQGDKGQKKGGTGPQERRGLGHESGALW